MKKGNIIFLNGVSSVGKSTLSKTLQSMLSVPYYRICCDDFMHMTPRHILHDDFDNQLLVTQGIMHETVRLFSVRGHNVVLDDVVLDLPDKNDWMYEYSDVFYEFPVMLVNVVCPPEELARREILRGDRGIGQALWQLEHSYKNLRYDLTVDTFAETITNCAQQIINFLNVPEKWTALREFKDLTDSQRGLAK